MDIIYSTDAEIAALFDAPSQEITESRHPHTEKITADAGPTMNQTREEPGVVFYNEDEIAKMFGSPTVIPFIPDTSESSSHLTVPGSSTDRQESFSSSPNYSSDADIDSLFGTKVPVFKRISTVLLR
jgi:hypothetical protein